jgi:hypothetical protein
MNKPEDNDTLPVHTAVRGLLKDDAAGFLDRLARLEQEYRQAVAQAAGPQPESPGDEMVGDERREKLEEIMDRLEAAWGSSSGPAGDGRGGLVGSPPGQVRFPADSTCGARNGFSINRTSRLAASKCRARLLPGWECRTHPAPANVRLITPAVPEHLGVFAPRLLEGVSEDRHRRKVPCLVHRADQ